jgi:hypothetical protein
VTSAYRSRVYANSIFRVRARLGGVKWHSDIAGIVRVGRLACPSNTIAARRDLHTAGENALGAGKGTAYLTDSGRRTRSYRLAVIEGEASGCRCICQLARIDACE